MLDNKFIVNPYENGMKNINCFYKNSPQRNIKEGGDARGGSIFETPPYVFKPPWRQVLYLQES